jgi:hypothetical protein
MTTIPDLRGIVKLKIDSGVYIFQRGTSSKVR